MQWRGRDNIVRTISGRASRREANPKPNPNPNQMKRGLHRVEWRLILTPP